MEKRPKGLQRNLSFFGLEFFSKCPKKAWLSCIVFGWYLRKILTEVCSNFWCGPDWVRPLAGVLGVMATVRLPALNDVTGGTTHTAPSGTAVTPRPFSHQKTSLFLCNIFSKSSQPRWLTWPPQLIIDTYSTYPIFLTPLPTFSPSPT